MSGSAPGISWSSSSTTVIFDAELVVDGRHLQADDAAADDQQALGNVVELERAGRVHDARIVVRDERQDDRLRAGGDDRLVEADASSSPSAVSTSSWFGEANLPTPVHDL